MDFEQKVARYLQEEGHEMLGTEGGLIFFKDLNGRVWCASEHSLYLAMERKGSHEKGNSGETSRGCHTT